MNPARWRLKRWLAGSLCLVGCVACGEEQRRAWVSILPAGEENEEADRPPAGPVGVSADGQAVLMGADTLFTIDRLPSRARGSPVVAARLHRVAVSPDSSLIAFTTAGANEAVGIWSRTAQVARLVDVFAAGRADTLAWSPDGGYLAYVGRSKDGIAWVGVADAAGRRLRHPLVAWLQRDNRSMMLQGWTNEGRLRVLVAPGSRPAGGLAHLWDPRTNNFVVESHLPTLAEQAPGGAPVPGGVFSIDLVGDAAPETVALFRTSEGAPAALVLEWRANAYRSRVTDPLVAPSDVGLEGWEEGSRALGLYAPARMDDRTLLFLELPSARSGVATVGAFVVHPDGRLELATIDAGETFPAVFQDGKIGDASVELGLSDLDADGVPEVVSAVARPEGETPDRSVRWSATVLAWRQGRLVPVPELEPAALERVLRAMTENAPMEPTSPPDSAGHH